MWLSVRNDRLFLVLLVALLALAWASLWVWGQSPYGRFLDHEALTEVTSEDLRLLVFFVAAWTLMIAAMMLPTTLPLIALFRTVSGSVKIGDAAEAELVAYKGASGKESALYDTIFSAVPGAPAYVGKASNYRANVPALNININLQDHNAISGPFRFEG